MNTFFAILAMYCEISYPSAQGVPKCSSYGEEPTYVRYSDIREFQVKEFIECKSIVTNDPEQKCKKTHLSGCHITMNNGVSYMSGYSCDMLKGL